MAKAKTADVVEVLDDTFEGLTGTDAAAAELAAFKAEAAAELAAAKAEVEKYKAETERLKAVEAEAAAAIAAMKAAEEKAEAMRPGYDLTPGRPPQRFLVKLKDGPEAVVEAFHPAAAYAAYRAVTGVTTSVHEPEITPTDAPLTRPS